MWRISSVHLRSVCLLLLSSASLLAQLIITTSDQSFSVGRVEVPLEATGGVPPYAWSLVSCAVPGLALRTDVPSGWSATAGLIGVATTAGSYPCTVRVTDGASGITTKLINITVFTLVVTSNWELPDGSEGVAYSQRVTATGGVAPLTFAFHSGSLPPPLVLAGDGLISGTPTTAGTYDFNFSVTDGISTTGGNARIYISKLNITTPVQLPVGTQGVPYSQTISVTGGTPSYTFSLGCCPPGEIALNSSTGVLSGTPNGPGYWQLQVTVTDSGGASARRNFALGVVGTPLTLASIDTVSLVDATIGQQRGYSIFVSGGKPPYTWSLTSGSLPPGMGLLNPSANPPNWANNALTLMGTPTSVGSYSFTLTAADSSAPSQSTSRPFTLRVSPLNRDGLSDATYGVAYNQKVRVLGGDPPYTLAIVQGAPPSGLTMDSSGQVTGTPAETGSFSPHVRMNGAGGELIRRVGINVWTSPPSTVWINDGNWLGDIMVNQPYSRTFSAGGGSGSFNWTLEPPSTLPAGLSLTGATLSGTPAAMGSYTFSLRATDTANANNFAVRAFQLQVTPVQILTNSQLPWTNVSSSYGTQLTAAGGTGTISWSLQPGSVAPPGLTLASNGILSGTPTFTGAFFFNAVATDSGTGRSMTGYFNVSVYPPGGAPPLWINTGDQTWSIGRVETPLDATGGTGTYTWSLTSCNIPGVALRTDVSSGWTAQAGLLGVATTPGTYSCGVQVTSGAQTATKTFTVKVYGFVVTNNWEFPDGSVGVPYSQQITTTGATGTVSLTLAPGHFLPPGLSLNSSTGRISSTPTTAGLYDFQVNISDSTWTFGAGFRIYISPMRITSPATLPNGTQNVAYSQTIAVAGGTLPYTFSLGCCSPVSCCTPGWLSLNSTTGVLSGTPTGPGYWSFPLVITDGTGAQLRKHYTLGVVGVPLTVPVINTVTLEDYTIGEQRDWMVVSISGGTPPYTWSVVSGALPPGISLQVPTSLRPYLMNWGVMLAGTPTAVGAYTFALQATDSSSPAQTTGRQFTVRVSALSPENLPDGILGVPYSRRLRILGGTQPYTYSIVQRALPNGLTMDASGQVTGTPTESGEWFWFLLRVTDSAGNSMTRGNGIRINGPSPAQVQINDGSDLGTAGPNQGYNRTFLAWGGTAPYTWTLELGSTLPGTLTLSATGTLSGTLPGTAGIYVFSVRATDSLGSYGVRTFRLNVTPLWFAVSNVLPYANVSSAYSATLTVGGATGTVTWSLRPGHALPPGLSLNSATGVISGIPSLSDSYFFDVIATDSGTGGTTTSSFTLLVYPAGTVPPLYITTGDQLWTIGRVEASLEATGGTGTYTWSPTSCNIPGVALRTDVSSNWTAKAGLLGVATTPGTYPCTVQVTSGAQNASKTFSVKVSGLVMTSSTEFPDGSVGVPYSQQITTAGGTGSVSFALQPGSLLPTGLSLNATTGDITGTPTVAGNYNFNVNITDSTGTFSRGMRIYISPIRISSPATLPNGTQNVAYSQTIVVTGGTPPYTFSLRCCTPGWLSLNSSTGVLSGTPTGPSYSSFNIRVTDSTGARLWNHYTLGVVGVPLTAPSITTASLEDYIIGEQISDWSIEISGGTPPYSWSLVSGSLPPGLSLQTPVDLRPDRRNAGVLLAGTPTAVGTYTFTLRATDSSSPAQVTARMFTVRVSNLTADGLPDGTLGLPYSQKIRVLGGTQPYTYSIVTGGLPNSLSMDASGQVTGTPTETGWFWFRLRVTDAAGNSLTRGSGVRINTTLPTQVSIDQGSDLGNINPNQAYSRTLTASGGTGPYTWTATGLPAWLSLSSAGVLSGTTPGTAGTHFFSVQPTDSLGNFGIRTFRLNVTPLRTSVSDVLPYGNVNTSYSTTLAVTGATGTVTYSLKTGHALPLNLSLSPTGVISGTPQAAGSYFFDIIATDSGTGGTVTRSFQIMIYPQGVIPPLYISTPSDLGVWPIGPVQTALIAGGGTGSYTWSLISGSLPDGLSLRTDKAPPFPAEASAGIIGLATKPGTYPFTLQVTSGAQSVSQAFTMKIVKLTIKDVSPLPHAFESVPYSYTFSNAGLEAVTWGVLPGTTLPSGLSLTSGGVLSGTPTTAATNQITITMSDGLDTVSRTFDLRVWAIQITTPGMLPNGTQNSAYSQTLTALNCTGGCTWSTSGGLPGGIILTSDGQLTGAPTGASTWNFSITATDTAARYYTKQFSLNVVGVPPILPRIDTASNLDDFSLGYPRIQQFSASRGTAPYAWNATGLPPGLSLRVGAAVGSDCPPASAELWGTPTRLSQLVGPDEYEYQVTLTVTDSASPANTVSRTYTVRVVDMVFDPWGGIPNGTRGQPYSANMRIIGGTLPYTWTMVSGKLPAGLSFDPATGIVSGIPLENSNPSAQFSIADTAPPTYIRSFHFDIGGGTSTISIRTGWDLGSTTPNQSYSTTLAACCVPSPYSWSVEAGSTLPPGLSLDPNTGVLSGTPTQTSPNPPKYYSFLIRAADSLNLSNYGVKEFRLNVTPLAVTSSTTLPWTNPGTAYSTTITYSGNVGAVTLGLALGSALPPGLSLNGTTGVINGTPGSTGYYSFSITLTDAAGNTWRTASFNISIYPVGGGPPLSLSFGPTLGPSIAGVITHELTATGGVPPYTYSYAPSATPVPGMRVQTGQPLPSGPSTSATGGFMGLVTTPGVYNTTIRVTDSSTPTPQTFDRAITLTVTPLSMLSQTSLPRVLVSTPYAFTFTAAGGTGTYTWSAPNPSQMPPGLTLNSAGLLSGTPTQAGTYNFDVKVTDTGDNSLTVRYRLQVTPFSITTPGVLPQGTVNTFYSQQLTASVPVVSWARTSRNLPSGLSLDSATGVISGTPTGTFYDYFTVRATDASNQTVQKVFSLMVAASSPQALSIWTGNALSDTPLGSTYTTTLTAFGGTPGYTWSLEPDSTLPPGLFLVSPGETICESCGPGLPYLAGRPTAVGSYSFTLRATDSASPTPAYVLRTFTLNVTSVWIQYSDLPLSGTTLVYNTAYTQPMLGLGGSGSYTWVAEQAMPTGLTLSAAGTVGGAATTTGTTTTRLRLTDGGAVTASRSVNFNVASGTAATLTLDQGPDLGTTSLGSTYAVTIRGSGSPLPTPNYTFSVVGALPSGCVLQTGHALPSGVSSDRARVACTPAATGTFTFALRVQDSSGNLGFRTYTLRVAADTIFTGGSNLANASVGVSYSQQLIAWGASQNWTVNYKSALPPNMNLSSSGLLTGSPTTPGDYSFGLDLTDGFGLTVSRTFSLRVSTINITDPAVLPTHAISNMPFTYAFTATGGGPSKTWSLQAGQGNLPTGLTLNTTTGVISGTTTSPGNYGFLLNVTDASSTFSKRFTLVVRNPYPALLDFGLSGTQLPDATVGQSYSRNLAPTGGIPPYGWSVASGSTLPPGLSLISGAALPANYNPYLTVLAGAPTSVGLYNFTLQASDAGGNSIRRTFTLNVTPVNLFGDTLRSPTYGSPYSQALTATGGTAPYSFSLVSGLLPPGLMLSPGGLISGTPTNTGTWTFTVKATDSGGASFSRSFTLIVSATTPQTVEITNSSSLLLQPMLTHVLLTATGGTPPYTFQHCAGTLPPGLSVVSGPSVSPDYAAGTWLLAGTITTRGQYSFTLCAYDSLGNFGRETITTDVVGMHVSGATPPAPVVTAGVPFTDQVYVTGGTPPHTFALDAAAVLPPGVTFSSTGVISGTTSFTGVFTVPFTVRDATGISRGSSRTITVLPAGKPNPLSLSPWSATSSEPSVGQEFLERLGAWAQGGMPPITWSLASGSLPPGIVLIPGNSSVGGYLTGVPTTPGVYTYSLRATDSAGQSVTGSVTTTVSSVGLTPNPLPPATVGVPYSVTMTPSGGAGPYGVRLRYNVGFPPGVSFGSGTFSGTPTLPGRYGGTLIAGDSIGAVLNRTYEVFTDSAITPVPYLSASPASLQLTFAQGETPPAAAINISSGIMAVSFTAGVSGIPGASLSVTSGTTPQTTTLSLPSLAIGTYYAAVEVSSPRSPNTPLSVRVAVTVTTPPPCSFTLSPASATIASGGGSGSVTITSGPTCNWTAAVSDPSMIALTSSASGTGSGTVSYNVFSNPGTGQRTGTITFSGSAPAAAHTITQFGSACSYTIAPTSASLSAAGGAGTITVNASLAVCAWTASIPPADSWITFTSAPSGIGSGAVSISVAANPTAINRSSTLTVAGLPFTVNQAGTACIVSLSSGGAEMPASGGSGSVNVALPVGCSYGTVPGPNWLTVISGGTGSGPGGAVTYSVAANSSTQPRAGSLLIGGQPFQITQAGVSCSFSITNDNPVFPAAGGVGNIAVTATAPACGWTTSSGAAWVNITSGPTGTGNGLVSFSVASNGATTPRSANITVAGQTAAVNEAGLVCTYSLRSSTGTVPPGGGSGSVGVVTASACSWTATSNSPWLAVTSGGGSGNGDAQFTAQPNITASERVGTLTVAGQTYTVTQPGAPCAYTLGSYYTTVASSGATGSFSFSSTTSGCSPSAVSFASWITATTIFGGTSGTVNFTAAANPGASERTAAIQLADQIFTITQIAASCAFSLNAYGAGFAKAGGSGEVLASPSALGCTPAVGASPEVTLGPLSGPVYNIFTQPYIVPRYDCFVTWIRTLYISISGQMFAIKQTSW